MSPLPGPTHRVRISLALHPYSNEPASSFPALTLVPHRMHVPRCTSHACTQCMHVSCTHSMQPSSRRFRCLATCRHAACTPPSPTSTLYHMHTRGEAPAPGSHHGRTGAYSGYLSRPSPLPLLFHGCARSSTQSWSLELIQPRARLRLTSNSRAYAPRLASAQRFGGAELRRLRVDRRAPRAVVASSKLRSQLLRTEPSSSCPCTQWQAPCAPRAARPQSAPTRPT